MLSPEYYESCADDIIRLYEQLENDIISDVIRRIIKTGKVTESAKHQLEQLQEAGLLYDDILAEIARHTDATSQHVKALFEDAGVETVSIDNEVYRENGLTPVDIRQSPAMRQTLEAGYRKTLGNMKNLTMTTAVTSQQAYINASNQAYMQVTSGAFSYQEAIKMAIKKTAESGATVLYPSGHQERIDVAVRRAVLTGVGQTCREIGMMNAEESGCDIMEITAHSGARPNHAKWQGQLVSLSGKNAGRIINGKKVLTLRQIGYGKGDGFGGWNCRHDWFPFFVGYSNPLYSKSDLDALDARDIEYNGKKYTEYEISQIQRRYEREIRAAKREQIAFKTAVQETQDPELKAVMQDSLNYSNDVVKRKQAKMRDFIQQTGQHRDYFREQNYADKNVFESGINKNKEKRNSVNSVDLKYINSTEYKNKFKNITDNSKVNEQIYKQAKAQLTHRNGTDKEDMCLIDSITGKIAGRQTNSQSDFGVDYNSSLKNAVLSHKPYTLISLHNHPTNNPPTGSDIVSNGYRKYKLGIVVTHNGKVYTYKSGNKPFSQDFFAKTVDNFRKLDYNLNENDAIIKTLDRLKADYGIEWSEIK